MLISPPFLPPRHEGQRDCEWVAQAMNGVANGFVPARGNSLIAGNYPVSLELGWHGGCHLIAPQIGNGNSREPVRAIADGTVLYVRQPKAQNDDANDPLNYGASAGARCWTSDGTVLIRHETAIGANAEGAITTVTFYSLYMHLDAIAENIRVNRPIYRKEDVGTAGYVYGQPHRIHFEIFWDDANLQQLTGRQTGDLPTGQDGRSNVVFGELYFHLPAGTAIYQEQPAANQPAPTAAPVHTTAQELIVGLRYAEGDALAGRRGDLTVTTYRITGETIDEALVTDNSEYALLSSSAAIVNAYPANGRPRQSAVYELLRFGRLINTANEVLNPANVPHWREIRYPGGRGWVNLNAANVHKFSDADFPHWKGWTYVDDSANRDSRCDSATIIGWLDANHDNQVSADEARAGLNDQAVSRKLERALCKFPTEWQASTIEERWGWLRTATPENPNPLSAQDFDRFRQHAEALCFWSEVAGLPATPWRMHPRQFIEVFRQCRWLSASELAQCLPRQSLSGTVPWATALARANTHLLALNRYFRKFYGASTQRILHALSQIYIETGVLSTVREGGSGNGKNYTAFYGRGYMQLTWAGNYRDYGTYRGIPNHAGAYSDARITNTSTHVESDGGASFRWFPRYDPGVVVSNLDHSGESSGFYWVGKRFRGRTNINRVCDLPLSPTTVGFCSWLVNGGPNGYVNRQQFCKFLINLLLDAPLKTGSETFAYPTLTSTTNNHRLTATFPPTEVPYNAQATANYAFQRP